MMRNQRFPRRINRRQVWVVSSVFLTNDLYSEDEFFINQVNSNLHLNNKQDKTIIK